MKFVVAVHSRIYTHINVTKVYKDQVSMTNEITSGSVDRNVQACSGLIYNNIGGSTKASIITSTPVT